MYDLPLSAIRAFTAVYEAGGVRPAARLLNVAHSSVSRHLTELEKWLGVPLFERRAGSRTLVFSPQGEALGQAGLKSLDGLRSALDAVRETPRRNAVVIATTPSVAALWLLPRLSNFNKAYPWVELSVLAEQRVIDPLQQGADIALRMGKGPWPGFECTPLMDEDLYPVMSSRARETSRRPESPEDLRHMTLLHDRDPNAPWSLWLEAHCTTRIDTRKGPRFGSTDLVLRAAAQGLGIALARGRLAAGDVASGVLTKPFGDLHVTLSDAYWIVRPAGAPERAAIPPVIEWLKTQARAGDLELVSRAQ